jgi:hypothetical protein
MSEPKNTKPSPHYGQSGLRPKHQSPELISLPSAPPGCNHPRSHRIRRSGSAATVKRRVGASSPRFDDSSTLVAEYRRLATRLETLLQKDVGMTYPRRDEFYENFIGTG